MTDKEILQGIDRLDAELPFDEVCVGGKDNWHDIDVHELLYEVRERIKEWHYPSRGELPDKDVECLVRTKLGNNFIAMIDSSDNCWCTGEFFSEYLEDDCIDCWQYIVPPKEEATKQCTNCGHYKNNVCERTKTHPNKPEEWTCLDWKEEV